MWFFTLIMRWVSLMAHRGTDAALRVGRRPRNINDGQGRAFEVGLMSSSKLLKHTQTVLTITYPTTLGSAPPWISSGSFVGVHPCSNPAVEPIIRLNSHLLQSRGLENLYGSGGSGRN